MAFALTRDTYRTNKITLNLTTRCHHYTLRVTLGTTIDVFPNPNPTDHLALFADHLHLPLFADNIHNTPPTPSSTPGAFGANMSDNIRII